MGVWGEGHSFATTLKAYPATTVFKHVDLHLKYFKHTLLAINDDFGSPRAPKPAISRNRTRPACARPAIRPA
jgi:hypothetical protein